MVRSIFAGGTSYQHQPTSEMIKDLNKMIDYAKQIQRGIDLQIKNFPDKTYWEKVPMEFKSFVNSCKMLAGSIIELRDTIDMIKNKKVDSSCVKRLTTLGRESSELNKELGVYWHQRYPDKFKDYEEANFKIVDSLYKGVRDFFASMMDLSNIGTKLDDFVPDEEVQIKQNFFLMIITNPVVCGIAATVIGGLFLWFLKLRIIDLYFK